MVICRHDQVAEKLELSRLCSQLRLDRWHSAFHSGFHSVNKRPSECVFGATFFTFSFFLLVNFTGWSGPQVLCCVSHSKKSVSAFPKMCVLGELHSDVSYSVGVISVQSLSCIRLFVTSWTAVRQTSLSFTNSWGLLKLMSIESVMPSNHLVPCPSLLLPSVFSHHQGLFRVQW